jgi:hypothetical protein
MVLSLQEFLSFVAAKNGQKCQKNGQKRVFAAVFYAAG